MIKHSFSKSAIKINEHDFLLVKGDAFNLLKKLEPKSVDVIFADPPYFLSNGGISVQSGKMVSVNKGKWDEGLTPLEKLNFNRKWIKLCREVLKDDGTIWISGTMHNIYAVGMALELEGFSIINNITWQKTNPPPNIACRAFTHSTETILWARKQLTPKKKGKHYFNYELMKEVNGGKQMKDVWLSSLTPKSEKKAGKHPTQKPLGIIEKLLLSSTKVGDIVLDPFNGSGTTGIACLTLNRRYIGLEKESDYINLTKKRYGQIKGEKA